MAKRGRPSAASLALATKKIELVERQRPPHDLTDEETEIWAAVVESQPADWFTPATVPLLAEYCRHVIHARRVGELIERATSDINPETKEPTLCLEGLDRLLKMADRESRAIAALATKMRITPQSITNHRGNRKPAAAKRPWE